MRLIDKIIGKKPKEEVSIRLKPNELLQFISDEYEKEFNGFKPFIHKKYKEINAILADIPEVINSLLAADALEHTSKRVEKVGDANKENIVNNLRFIIEKIKTYEEFSLDDTFNFCINAKSALKTVLENTHRSQLYIRAIYPEEAQKIVSTLSKLEDNVDELFIHVRDIKMRKDSFDKFSNEIENYKRMQVQIQESHKKIKHIESKIDSMKKNIHDSKEKLNELENSQEFERAKQFESEINILKEKISDIDHNIQRLFTPLSKVFSRMKKQDMSGICLLSPEHRQILEKILYDPTSALEDDMDSFFAGIRPRIENGSLGLKDQMCEKALQHLDKLCNSKELSSQREKRKEYSLKLKNVTDELNSLNIYRNKEQLMQQISRDEHMLKIIEGDLNTEKKHLHTLTEESELLESGLNMEIKGLFEKDIEIEY
ncbi:MAG: hypothetical protein H5T43_05955 [Methanomethylovorans sp.]|jgi:hypothetical protein|nr:hypothetical protein [Methanomethylovorans sp.]